MAMTDIAFIFIFLPISFLAVIVQPKWKKYVLLLMSLFYYACGSPKYFVIFLVVLVVNVALAYVVKVFLIRGDSSASFGLRHNVKCRHSFLL